MSSDKPARKGSKASAFSDEELAIMQEVKAERKKGGKADGEADVLAKIAEMEGLDRTLAERIHAIVKTNAPQLTSKTWYSMPAYANAEGKIVCFFQSAAKFKARYATLGFNDAAKLDDGTMWPTSFALTELGPAEEKKIAEMVRKAAG